MHISRKQIKWIRILILLLLIRVVLGGIVFYFVEFRFKNVLQFLVKRESKGLYAFDADGIDVSIWKGTILFRNSSLTCTDPQKAGTHLALQVPELYFSLHSIRDFILRRSTTVDSVAIISPAVQYFPVANTAAVRIDPEQWVNGLKKVLSNLQVRSLIVRDASFGYTPPGTGTPFTVSHISLLVKNFSRESQEKKLLFSSEDVDLTISEQDWDLPGGRQHLSFRKFHFSSANPLVELDTVNLISKPEADRNGFDFAADHLFFNSSRLRNILTSSQLDLDTLICYKPVLKVAAVSSSEQAVSKPGKKKLTLPVDQLNIGFIDVKQGQLFINRPDRGNANYITREANLKIFNLSVTPGDTLKKIRVDSVQLTLQGIQFLTADSLYQLSIREFAIARNGLVLRDAEYGPTEFNHNAHYLKFSSPLLELRNVDFQHLLEKKLSGSVAILERPEIRIVSNKVPVRKASRTKLNDFYRSLHELRELITVDSFHLVNATLNYQMRATSTVMNMQGLNADILLNRFLSSDSLREIKRSLPSLSVKNVNLQSPQARFEMSNFRFEGDKRHNWVDSMLITLADGTRLKAENIYWEIFSWDLYENDRIIQIEDISVGRLAVISTRSKAAKDSINARILPEIHIGRIDINNLEVNQYTAIGDSLGFQASEICMDSVYTAGEFFYWGNGLAQIQKFFAETGAFSLSAGSLHFTNEGSSSVKDISFRSSDGLMDLEIPRIETGWNLHSTDFNVIRFDSLNILDPSIALVIGEKKEKAHKKESPVSWNTNKLNIRNASLQVSSIKPGDSLLLFSKIDIRSDSLRSGPGLPFGFASLEARLRQMTLKNKDLSISVPSADFLSTGGKFKKDTEQVFSAAVRGEWHQAGVRLKKPGLTLSSDEIEGAIDDISFNSKDKRDLNWLLQHISLSQGNVRFETRSWTGSLNQVGWKAATKELHLEGLKMNPTLSAEEYFKTGWQRDYITVAGKNLDFNKFRLKLYPNDTSLTVSKILIDGVDLTTFRDGRMPREPGIIRLMPTILMEKIPYPVWVDTVLISNSSVTVKEISNKSGREGITPIRDLNAFIPGFGNAKHSDSLRIFADAKIFDTRVNPFYYAEKYHDSLSGFTMRYRVYPMEFARLNPVTEPLASLKVRNGTADTVYAHWTGNKYAAIGNMKLYYNDLKIRVLNTSDPERKTFKLDLINMLANTFILRKKNREESVTYFVRDREKFVFNFWVKTTLKGVISSVGVVSNSKYLKQYEQDRANYYLPEFVFKK